MIKELKVPMADLIAAAVDHFAVKGKVRIADKDRKSDALCDMTVTYGTGKTKIVAPFIIDDDELFRNNRPHALHRMVRDKFGKALHHLIHHGADFKGSK